MVMFDSLNRKYLPQYGAEGIELPAFERLAAHTVTFDNCYGGSMPCMPARRELHTGRSNFLHRSWGPLEPFDDSVPEILRTNGVYSHLVTDHQHYWEDGGATYHNRYSTFETFRGQQGDKWKGHVADPVIPETVNWRRDRSWRQDWINRGYMANVKDHPQFKTIEAGVEFIATNHAEDQWFLQIETFDPHEPFFSYDEHKSRRPHHYDGDHFDWPDYRRVVEDQATVNHAREEYRALLTFCDDSLGRVLDAMDEFNMWDDTLLMVCTDHGLMVGERGWWGKNVQPWYDETIHTPLFVWDPRAQARGERRSSLAQTVDFGPTLLGFFGLELSPDMTGRDLAATLARDEPVRNEALFGVFGGHICVTDGHVVYMRASATETNRPLLEHTLMPTHMDQRFHPEEIASAELISPLTFSKGAPLLRMPGSSFGNPYVFGTLLYDLDDDPDELVPLMDSELEMRMVRLLVGEMRRHDAPPSQFERVGLPATGDVRKEHLQVETQWHLVQQGLNGPVAADKFPNDRVGVHTPLHQLMADETLSQIISNAMPVSPALLDRFGRLSPWQVSVMSPVFSAEALRRLDIDLSNGATPR